MLVTFCSPPPPPRVALVVDSHYKKRANDRQEEEELVPGGGRCVELIHQGSGRFVRTNFLCVTTYLWRRFEACHELRRWVMWIQLTLSVYNLNCCNRWRNNCPFFCDILIYSCAASSQDILSLTRNGIRYAQSLNTHDQRENGQTTRRRELEKSDGSSVQLLYASRIVTWNTNRE